MTVYILPGGGYTGLSVLLEVFTTRELAEARQSKYGPSYISYTIEEIEVTE